MSSVEESIKNWINTFEHLKIHISDLRDLADGVDLFRILQEVSPSIWRESEMDMDHPDSTLTMVQNVEHVFSGIQEFYKTKLLNELKGNEVNTTAIGEERSLIDIMKLCEYTIGVVVQCDEKDEYIGSILNLDEDTQADLMKIIQRNMASGSREGSSIDHDDHSISQSLSEENLSASMTVNFETQLQLDKLKKQNQSLKLKLSDTEEENGKLKAQIEKLTIDNKELSIDLDIERKNSK